MPSIRPIRFSLVALSLLTLSGCGEGWVMVPYNKTPYGDRTAGHGVEYVRAHMLPQKGPALKPAMPEETPLILPQETRQPQTAPVMKDAEPMFDKKQKK